MERLRASMRMTAVRLSAVFLALFAVFAAILVFYVTATASNILQSQNRERIAEELGEIGRVYRGSGIVGLVRSIDRRSRQPGASLYLVTDVTGRILAGNVENIDAGILDKTGFTQDAFGYERFAEDANDRFHQAVAEVVRLPNGMRVLVGRDQTDGERLREIVRSAVILALGLMGVGALFAWLLVGRTALHRLDRMSVSTARIMAGDLEERLPITGARDEFDRLSENLNTLLARIALLQQGLRQVSDNIAHDLRTPLTRLRTRAEIALADRSDAADPRAALEDAIADADGTIRTFDALLMISRVEAGSHPAGKEPSDVAAIVRDVAELYEPLAEETGGRLDVRAGEAVTVSVNRELIAQAVSNLIDNALKYAQLPDRRLIVSLAASMNGGRCLVEVEDNGLGIPAEKRVRVLERFFRLDESRSKPGSGLGLSLVQAVARLHGGDVRLEDAAPGLRVVLDLPVAARSLEASP